MNKDRFLIITLVVLVLAIIGVVAQSVWRQSQAAGVYKSIAAVFNDASLTKDQKLNRLDNLLKDLNSLRSHPPILNVSFSTSQAGYVPGYFGMGYFGSGSGYFPAGGLYAGNISVFFGPNAGYSQGYSAERNAEYSADKGPVVEAAKRYCVKPLTRDGVAIEVCAGHGCYLNKDLTLKCNCNTDEGEYPVDYDDGTVRCEKE